VNPFIWGDVFYAVGEGNALEGVAPLGKAPLASSEASSSGDRERSATMGWFSDHPDSVERTSWKHGEPHDRQQGATNLRGGMRCKPSKS
jgi:hypothetical protein